MDGGVTVSPNLKHTRIKIDINGREIDPKTNQVVGFVDDQYTPSQMDIKSASEKKPPTEEEILKAKNEIKEGIVIPPVPIEPIADSKSQNSLADLISKKVSEAVDKAIGNINIEKMVEDAISKSFK